MVYNTLQTLYICYNGRYKVFFFIRRCMSLDNIIIHDRSDMDSNTWIPEDSYVLADTGWRPLWSILVGDRVLTNSCDGVLSFNIVNSVETEKQTTIESSHSFWKFQTGKEHKWFGYRRMTKSDNSRVHVYDHKPCIKPTKEFHIKNCGVYVGVPSAVTEDECRILGWLLADGYVKWEPESFAPSTSHGTKRGVTAQITQNDNKYGSEIKELLTRTHSYTRTVLRKNTVNICRDYYIDPVWFRAYWARLGFSRSDKHKINVVTFLLNQPKNNLIAFLDAFFKADGHTTRKGKGVKVITQNQNNLSEGVMIAGYLLGYNISSGEKGGIYINKRGDVNICKWYKLGEKPHQTTMRLQTQQLPPKNMVQLSVNGYAIYRQGDVITCA